jgi:hypothetical protein
MLEGDMGVLELPYQRSLMFNEAGSNFSASPAFSGLFMDNGDMVR